MLLFLISQLTPFSEYFIGLFFIKLVNVSETQQTSIGITATSLVKATCFEKPINKESKSHKNKPVKIA